MRRAARLLGTNGLGRVLAVHFEATCYCNEHLTDGRLDNSIVKLLESDRDPIQVFRVFARDSIRLAIRIKGGFQLHDYHDYQPSKQEVEEARVKERDRKRRQRHRPALVPAGHQGVSGDPIRSDPTDPIQPEDQEREAEPLRGSPPVLVFPTKRDESWPLTPELVTRWAVAYPGIDIVAECRRALIWCEANPSKRKTVRGMSAFLVRWLSRSVRDVSSRHQTKLPYRPAPEPNYEMPWQDECVELHGRNDQGGPKCGNAFMHDANMAAKRAAS